MTASAEGSVFLRTDLSVKALNLRLQLDEEVTREIAVTKTVEVNQEIAEVTDEAAFEAEVAAESVPQMEEITEIIEEKIVTENTLEAPHSDTHQLSAPTVTLPEVKGTNTTTNQVKPNIIDETDGSGDTSELSANESSPSKTSSESEEEVFTVQPNLSRYIQSAPGFISQLSVDALADTGTPFSYTTDETGTYPTHGTNTYLPGTSTSPNVKNFDYGTDVTNGTVPEIEHVLGQNNFLDGYHSYDFGQDLTDVLMKKQ